MKNLGRVVDLAIIGSAVYLIVIGKPWYWPVILLLCFLLNPVH